MRANREAQRLISQARRLNHIRDCATRLRQPNVQSDNLYKHSVIKEIHSSVNAFSGRADVNDDVTDVQNYTYEHTCDLNFNYLKLTLEADRRMIKYRQFMNAQSRANKKR